MPNVFLGRGVWGRMVTCVCMSESLHCSSETINKVKRQPSEWEKIIANKATDKELISKIYKQLMQLNTRNINAQSKNGPKN